MDVITTIGMSTTWLPGREVPWEWRNHRDALRVPTWGGEEAVEGGGVAAQKLGGNSGNTVSPGSFQKWVVW